MRAVLTPTGSRAEAFDFCQTYIQRQKINEPITWIIVDDGQKPVIPNVTRSDIQTVYIRPEHIWKPDDNTQGANLLVGLEAAIELGGDKLMLTVWEDDDWYHEDWLETIFGALSGYDMVGEVKARYYNVRSRRYKQLSNYRHASLRTTAVTGAGIAAFKDCLQIPARFYDLKLWDKLIKKRLFDWQLTTGIKGLPGRSGLAPGHEDNHGSHDNDLVKLRQWIGEDAEFYRKFYQPPQEEFKMPKNTMMVALEDFKYGERGRVSESDVFELRANDEEVFFKSRNRARDATREEIDAFFKSSSGGDELSNRRARKKPANRKPRKKRGFAVENSADMVVTETKAQEDDSSADVNDASKENDTSMDLGTSALGNGSDGFSESDKTTGE